MGALNASVDRRRYAVVVVRVQMLEEEVGAVFYFIRRVAQHGGPAGVVSRRSRIQIGVPGAKVTACKRHIQLLSLVFQRLPAGPEGFFGLLAFGDVRFDAAHADGAAVSIVLEADAAAHPSHLALGLYDAALVVGGARRQ